MNRSTSERGSLIVIEGIDGSGSTTQCEALAQRLRGEGREVFTTQEPSSGPAGLLIRLALSQRLLGAPARFHDPDEPSLDVTTLDPATLALLYAADRADHVTAAIAPNLSRGRVVICNRYLLSTIAYQGVSLDPEWLYSINRMVPVPALTLVLDLPVENALSRMRATRWTQDLFENAEQLRRTRERYLELIATADPRLGPIVVIDGTQGIDSITAEIHASISRAAVLPDQGLL